MRTTKGKGLTAGNSRPAKTLTICATDFIAPAVDSATPMQQLRLVIGSWVDFLSTGISSRMTGRQARLHTSYFAGAIAASVLHDCKVNLFGFPGFPLITVARAETALTVSMSFDGINVVFELPRADAVAAAQRFRKTGRHDAKIFEPVQKAVAELEFKVVNARLGNSK